MRSSRSSYGHHRPGCPCLERTPDTTGLDDERGIRVLPWKHQLRTVVGRFLTHLVLAAALAVVPALRVLCYGSCVSEAGSMAENMVSDPAPACHEPSDNHHLPQHESDSAPQPDDCTHGGVSSPSGLSGSVKSVGDDGLGVLVVSTFALAHLSITSSDIRRDAPPRRSTGQLLGLFLTPLRI
jgi:hypothetical protein